MHTPGVGDGGTRSESDREVLGTRREGLPPPRAAHRDAEGNGHGTRREGGGPPGTRREGADRPADAPIFVRGLPPALSATYEVVEELPASGTEADVVVARPREGGRSVVLKLYRRGVQPDADAVARLSVADPA